MVFRQFAYLAVAAAVLLEGCRKENLSGDAVPLSFAAAFAGETRAPSAVQPDQADYLIAEGNRIGVFGTLTRAGEEESTVFEKQAVTCGSDLSWSYRPLKYWRKTGLYDFTAVFPYDSDCLAGTTGKRLLIRHSAAAKNVDILVSRAQRDVSGGNTSPVDLTFHHACAAVRFLFRTSEHYDYRLNSFQLENLRVALDLTEEWAALESGSQLITAGLFVRKAFAEEHPEAFAAFLEEYRASTEYVNTEVEAAAQLVEKYGIVKAAIAQKAIPNCNIVCITGAEMREMAEGYLQVLFDQNPTAVGGAMPGEDFYRTGE